jgi:hypothetical protein
MVAVEEQMAAAHETADRIQIGRNISHATDYYQNPALADHSKNQWRRQ